MHLIMLIPTYYTAVIAENSKIRIRRYKVPLKHFFRHCRRIWMHNGTSIMLFKLIEVLKLILKGKSASTST